MKKIITALMLVITVGFVASCGKEEKHDPLKTFYDYMEAYENFEFEKMYSLLDAESQNEMSKVDYLEIYTMIYEGIPISEAKMEPRMDSLDIEQKVSGEEEVRIPMDFNLMKGEEAVTYSADVTLKKVVEEKDNVSYKVVFTKDLVYNGYELGDTLETKVISPVRGEIFDRNDKPIAMNGEVLWVGMVSGKSGDTENEAIAALSQMFSISEETIEKKLSQSWVKENMFVDLTKASMERKAEIDVLLSQYPGITYRVVTGRVYPYKEATAHLTGYLGLINEDEYKELEPLGFPIDTMVGRTGLELLYEEKLRGQIGTESYLKDRNGEVKEKLTVFQNNKGEDLYLTIDIEEQVKLYNAMAGEPGTASHVDYKTGEVHALVSSPAYDPNTFVFGHTKDSYNALLEDEKKPLMNRFTQLYSPGSTIKPLVAALALDRINYDENIPLEVSGLEWQKDSSWGNYAVTRVTDPGRAIALKEAMVYSDNIYFAKIALELKEDTMIKGMEDFGIGKPLNLGFKFEKSQLTSEKGFSSEVLLADTGYGQGQVLFHSLTLPEALSAIADEGNRKTLSLFKGEEKGSFNILEKNNADKVFGFMKEVIDDPKGTGHLAFIDGRNLGGKTGTAEVGLGEEKLEIGWFTVIEKEDQRPFITTMMLEDTKGRGGSLLSVEKVKAYLLK